MVTSSKAWSAIQLLKSKPAGDVLAARVCATTLLPVTDATCNIELARLLLTAVCVELKGRSRETFSVEDVVLALDRFEAGGPEVVALLGSPSQFVRYVAMEVLEGRTESLRAAFAIGRVQVQRSSLSWGHRRGCPKTYAKRRANAPAPPRSGPPEPVLWVVFRLHGSGLRQGASARHELKMHVGASIEVHFDLGLCHPVNVQKRRL